jgi:hypothetical protein
VSQATIGPQERTTGVPPDMRRRSRAHLPLSAQVFRADHKALSQPADIRDINILGAFLYCEFAATVGEVVWVELTPVQSSVPVILKCEGRVVRVEGRASNGLLGIAVEFNDFVAQQPNESTRDYASGPVTHWTVDMIDRKFARRPEFQAYASRIQGAA